MTPHEMVHFVTWHFEVGSALDTRASTLGSGLKAWEGQLCGPRFDVNAQVNITLEGQTLIAKARMEAAPNSHIFDMVLGCRLLCPPGILARPALPEIHHAGTGRYVDLPNGSCKVSWGEYGSCYDAQCTSNNVPNGFEFVPYAADEPDGWRLHSRIRASNGTGFRRLWLLNKEVLRKKIGRRDQNVMAENKAQSPLYRFWRSGDFREQVTGSSFIFTTRTCIHLPEGFIA